MEKHMSIFFVRNFLRQSARLLSALALALVIFTSIAKSMGLPSSSSAGTEGGVSAVWILCELEFHGNAGTGNGYDILEGGQLPFRLSGHSVDTVSGDPGERTGLRH